MSRLQTWMLRGWNAEILIVLIGIVGLIAMLTKPLEGPREIELIGLSGACVVMVGMGIGACAGIRSYKRRLTSAEGPPSKAEVLKSIRKIYPWIGGLTLLAVVDSLLRSDGRVPRAVPLLMSPAFRVLLAVSLIVLVEFLIWLERRTRKE